MNNSLAPTPENWWASDQPDQAPAPENWWASDQPDQAPSAEAPGLWGTITDTAKDMALGAGSGLIRGVTDLADMPGQMTGLGIDTAADALGLGEYADDARRAVSFLPLMGGARPGPNGLAQATAYDPHTTAGRYAESVGTMAPGLIGPGGMARKAAGVVASGIGAELAGDDPVLSAIGAIIGDLSGAGVARVAGHALGQTGPRAARRAAESAIAARKAEAATAYAAARSDTTPAPDATIQAIIDALTTRRGAYDAPDALRHPGAYAADQRVLGALSDALPQPTAPGLPPMAPRRSLSAYDLDLLRQDVADALPTTASKSERRLARMTGDAVADAIAGMDTPGAEALARARPAHQQAEAARTLLRARDDADLTGGAPRKAVAQMLKSDKRSRYLTDAQRAEAKAVVKGASMLERGAGVIQRITGGGVAPLGGLITGEPTTAAGLIATNYVAGRVRRAMADEDVARLAAALAGTRLPQQPSLSDLALRQVLLSQLAQEVAQ